MAEKKEKLYMEMQLEELKAFCNENSKDKQEDRNEIEREVAKKSNVNHDRSENNAKIAALYEDVFLYKEELAEFELELVVIQRTAIQNLVDELNKSFPKYEGDYLKELNEILLAYWTQFVEVNKTHPSEHLDLIKATDFPDIASKFAKTFPEYTGNFEEEVKEILVKRWGMLIGIKKEHIKEEISEIKVSGLKPGYAERIYKRYHGIE